MEVWASEEFQTFTSYQFLTIYTFNFKNELYLKSWNEISYILHICIILSSFYYDFQDISSMFPISWNVGMKFIVNFLYSIIYIINKLKFESFTKKIVTTEYAYLVYSSTNKDVNLCTIQSRQCVAVGTK